MRVALGVDASLGNLPIAAVRHENGKKAPGHDGFTGGNAKIRRKFYIGFDGSYYRFRA